MTELGQNLAELDQNLAELAQNLELSSVPFAQKKPCFSAWTAKIQLINKELPSVLAKVP